MGTPPSGGLGSGNGASGEGGVVWVDPWFSGGSE